MQRISQVLLFFEVYYCPVKFEYRQKVKVESFQYDVLVENRFVYYQVS